MVQTQQKTMGYPLFGAPSAFRNANQLVTSRPSKFSMADPNTSPLINAQPSKNRIDKWHFSPRVD